MGGNLCLNANALNNDIWILDTDATSHMSTRIEWLDNLKECSSMFLFSIVKTLVNVFVNDDKRSIGVLHYLNFKSNLLLVAKLTKDLNCVITFYQNFAIM